MKYFLIAGEASGDLHAAHLISELHRIDPDAECMGLGGDKMFAAGCRIYQDYRKMAFMGVVAVLRNLGQVRRNFQIAKQALLHEKPDVLILIDYPSFNLKMAAFARKMLPDIKIVYYIPPKVWAWKTYRIHQIARLCDRVLGIFPFETEFYQRYGYSCEYVGNPTVDAIREWKQSAPSEPSEEFNYPFLAILPGSRPHEIRRCLPMMLAAARTFMDYNIVVTAAPGMDDSFYDNYLRDGEQLTRNTYGALSNARAAIVNSGTATLETALIGCPQEAVYSIFLSKVLGFLRPLIFSIPHFTLVNIVAQKEVIQEMVSYKFSERCVREELDKLLNDDTYRRQMLAEYQHIAQILGDTPAAVNAAKIISSLK
jgi:lipid-A-disaccharide synthase